MWPFKPRTPDMSLTGTLRTLQANLVGKDKDPGFLMRLAVSMDKCPEPYEWIMMVLRERRAMLERRPTGHDLAENAIRQAEIRAEIKLLRQLAHMAIQAKMSLDAQRAMTEPEFEAVETANH